MSHYLRLLYSTLLILLLSSNLHSQEEKAIKTLEILQSQPIDSLISWMNNNSKSSAEVFQPVQKLAIAKAYENASPEILAQTHTAIANWFAYNGFFPSDSVVYHSEKIVENYDILGDELKTAAALKTLSIDYMNIADNESSLRVLLRALNIYEKLNDQEGIAGCYKNLSSLYSRTDEAEKAIEYGKKALVLFEKSKNYAQIGITYLNLIESYSQLEDYPAAIEAANLCIQTIEEKSPDEIFVMVRAYAYRTEVYTKMGDYEKALADATKSWTIAKNEVGEKRAETYRLEIGNALRHMGKYEEALPHLETAVAAYQENEGYNVSQPYNWLSENYRQLGRFEEALKFNVLASEIEKKNLESKVENLKSEGVIKYETGKKDQEIAAQEVTLKQQTRIQILMLGLAGLFAIFILVLYRNNRKIRTFTSALEKKNKENELLLKEIHHRVKNNLQTVSSLLSLQAESISDPSAFDAVQESKNRVTSMALIHQKLYQGENLASIEMKDYLITISEAIKDSFGEKANKVKLEVEMKDLELDVDTAVPIGLIANELLTNAFKYAFEKDEKGLIIIKMEKVDDDQIKLHISDNGKGTHKDFKPGFGSLLVNLLTTQLDGHLSKSDEKGTTIDLVFPAGQQDVA